AVQTGRGGNAASGSAATGHTGGFNATKAKTNGGTLPAHVPHTTLARGHPELQQQESRNGLVGTRESLSESQRYKFRLFVCIVLLVLLLIKWTYHRIA
ncbi:MAG: hypothetical protein ACKPKO_28245, partial [Candidatus Fonsibacter sp.]